MAALPDIQQLLDLFLMLQIRVSTCAAIGKAPSSLAYSLLQVAGVKCSEGHRPRPRWCRVHDYAWIDLPSGSPVRVG